MSNRLINSAVGYRRREEFGPELNTTANAVSDPNGTEADAITGWAEGNLNGTGANVFESQSSIVSAGTYAFKGDSNDTPTSVAYFSVNLEAAPFSLIDGDEIKVSFDIRHVGVGDVWKASLSSLINGKTIPLVNLTSGDTTWQSIESKHTHSGSVHYLVMREDGTNSGGVYFDNLSVKKKL